MLRPLRPPKAVSDPPRARGGRRLVLFLGAAAVVALLFLIAVGFRTGILRPGSGPPGLHLSSQGVSESQINTLAQYAGSASCRQCHEEEYELWRASNHALAERLTQADLDRTAFDPMRSLGRGARSTQLAWSKNAPQITIQGAAGKPENYEALRVIGNDPLRQFLVRFPGGRYQATEVAYDPHSNQWFNVFGQEDRNPGEWGHWTGRGMNWNSMCADCHNTRLRRNYDETSDRYHTTMAEPSVGCEACHGPMRAHNEWQSRFGKSHQIDPTVHKLTRAQTLDNCGACHARRSELTADFKPGDAFLDNFEPALVDASDLYYADGQVRGEDYEYGSFLGSRMHLRGVHCLDCHNPHSMKPLLPGNWLCLRCHNGTVTNAPAIDPVAHSHHKVYGYTVNPNPAPDAPTHLSSATGLPAQPLNTDLTAYRSKEIQEQGGECINCHMPQTVYMQRHGRHDHGFTIPDPLLSKQFGIPNACNRCHQDQTADWALSYCEQWYGAKMERPSRRRAQIIARAQRGEDAARDQLVGLLGTEESAYWQAVTLGLLSHWSAQAEVGSILLRHLADTNALVRTSAASALDSALVPSNPGVGEALEKCLHDPVRSVRIAAAASLGAKLDPGSPAGSDFQHYLAVNADQPTGQAQQGIACSLRNDLQSALSHFEKAVAWDPYSPPFRHELAVALSGLNCPEEAKSVLEEACRVSPRDAESHFRLGLACNELGDVRRAAEELKAAVALDAHHARAWYNLGLAQNALGQSEEAIESLARAQAADPQNGRSAYARATILARLGRTAAARIAAQQALDQQPDDPEVKRLLELLSN